MSSNFDLIIKNKLKSLYELENFSESLSYTIIPAINNCLINGKKLLFCGNGGSAADASHFATEFVGRFSSDRNPYPALSLSDSVTSITSISNDYSFDDIFSRQINAFGNYGDILIAISTSGYSNNIKKALMASIDKDMHSLALLGKDGGICTGIASLGDIIFSSSKEVDDIQDVHHILLHCICKAVDNKLI